MFIFRQSFPFSSEHTLQTEWGFFFLFLFSAAYNEETHIHLVSFLYIFHSFVHILYFLTFKSFVLFILTNSFNKYIMSLKITITAVDYFKPYQYSCHQQDRQNKTVYINGFQKGEKVEKKTIHGRTAHCSYGKRFPVTPRNHPAGRGCVKTSDED